MAAEVCIECGEPATVIVQEYYPGIWYLNPDREIGYAPLCSKHDEELQDRQIIPNLKG